MSLFRNTKMVRRSFEPGTREKGEWKEGKPKDSTFWGTAQPASGKALELLPEGKRHNEAIEVFDPIEVQFTPADEDAKRSGDIIVYKKRLFEVQVAKEFDSGLLPHWELVAVKVGVESA